MLTEFCQASFGFYWVLEGFYWVSMGILVFHAQLWSARGWWWVAVGRGSERTRQWLICGPAVRLIEIVYDPFTDSDSLATHGNTRTDRNSDRQRVRFVGPSGPHTHTHTHRGGKVVKVTKRTTWPLFFSPFPSVTFFCSFPHSPPPLPLFPSSVSMTFAF